MTDGFAQVLLPRENNAGAGWQVKLASRLQAYFLLNTAEASYEISADSW